MSIEENKALIRRFIESWNDNKRNPDMVSALAKEFLDPDFVAHNTMYGDVKIEQYIEHYTKLILAFPDLTYTISDMVAEDDKVIVQVMATGKHLGEFQGVPATGRDINVMAFGLYKIANNKFIENWGLVDGLTQMKQLGLLPPN
jgi:steroid delta-isomerase-like uncharacterized protein